MTSWRIIEGDCREALAALPERSVHTCVTSPPYFGLRDYGHDGQIGLEPTPDEFVAALVDVFRGVRRVLRDDGTVWLNLGDSYSGPPRGNAPGDWTGSGLSGIASQKYRDTLNAGTATTMDKSRLPGVKQKDLLGIPWMVAFALRADGWYLRSDIIWSKPNPMPESVTDRPTKAHEYVFLLSKGPRYFYDADAIKEPAEYAGPNGAQHSPYGQGFTRRSQERKSDAEGLNGRNVQTTNSEADRRDEAGGSFNNNPRLRPIAPRNKRSVWTVATQPYAGAHFATFPPKLIEPCILAGAPERACGECGAPWVRVTEGGESTYEQRKALGYDQPQNMVVGGHPGHHNGIHPPGMTHDVTPAPKRTLGFEPSCPHGDGSATGVVLDPFAGSGTTGMVALRHGRSFVGVELNPAYAAMARWRIRDDAPLLNSVAEAVAA